MDEKLEKLIQNASKVARQNVRFLWREQFWNLRRSKNNCDYVAALCTVSDYVGEEKIQEHFWLSQIMCDGPYLYGTIAVAPAILKGIQQGAVCTVPLDRVEDWMYVINNKVYGAYTINTRRSFLSGQELAMYDQGWGYDFGNALYTEKYPVQKKAKPAKQDDEDKPPAKFFGMTITKKHKIVKKGTIPKDEDEANEPEQINRELDHPDAIAAYSKYKALFQSQPQQVNALDENGWTPLHNHAMAGNRHIVQLLLDCGADPNPQTQHGHRALELAKIMGWMEVVRILDE